MQTNILFDKYIQLEILFPMKTKSYKVIFMSNITDVGRIHIHFYKRVAKVQCSQLGLYIFCLYKDT